MGGSGLSENLNRTLCKNFSDMRPPGVAYEERTLSCQYRIDVETQTSHLSIPSSSPGKNVNPEPFKDLVYS